MQRKPKTSADSQRKKSKREPYDRVLIVCEGKKTEPEYFKGLKNHYRLNNANIAVTSADGSDPVSVVKHAKKLQQEESKQGEKFDKVYCVFDRDEHKNFNDALKDLKQNCKKTGLESACSWPCFEFWLLLHFEYSRAPFDKTGSKTAAQSCQSKLKEKLPDYKKGMGNIFAKLLDRLDAGIQNAQKAQQDVQASGAEDPSTEVHKLVSYLKGLNEIN